MQTTTTETTNPNPNEPTHPTWDRLIALLPDVSVPNPAAPDRVRERLWHLLTHGELLADRVATAAEMSDDPQAAIGAGMLQAMAPLLFGAVKSAVQSTPSEQQVSYLIFLLRTLTGVLQADWDELAWHDELDRQLEAQLLYGDAVPALPSPETGGDPAFGAAHDRGA